MSKNKTIQVPYDTLYKVLWNLTQASEKDIDPQRRMGLITDTLYEIRQVFTLCMLEPSEKDEMVKLINSKVTVPCDDGEYTGIVQGVSDDRIYIGGPVGAVSYEWFKKNAKVGE